MGKNKITAKASADAPEADRLNVPPADENNRCFIITPIGDDDSEIRRATDGLIDAVIGPALQSHGLEVEVAHRNYDQRSITRRIVEHVIESRLVVANLTSLNPNVMYELAVRHSAAKPAITIAEQGTRLPFDLKDELTLFYSNDMQGVVELRNKFERAVSRALSSTKFDNPITRYTQTALLELKGDAPDALTVVLDRLDSLGRMVSNLQGGDLQATSSSHNRESDGQHPATALSDAMSKRGIELNEIHRFGGLVPHADGTATGQYLLRVTTPTGMAEAEINDAISAAGAEVGLEIGSATYNIPDAPRGHAKRSKVRNGKSESTHD